MQLHYSMRDRTMIKPVAETIPSRLHIGFVMSTELGLKTQYLNWKSGLTDPNIVADWIVVDWWQPHGLLTPLGSKIHSIINRMLAHRKIHRGLAHGPFDALFLAGHMLRAVRSALERQPYFLTLDTTTKQLHDFGALYGKVALPISWLEDHRYRSRREQYVNATALFPWSRWCAESLVKDYSVDPARLHVIPPGVDLDYWRCEQRPASDPVHILFVGGHFYRKGGDMLLRWAQATSARNWRLHLVTRDAVKSDDPRVRIYRDIAPNSDALRQLYQQADLFVLPTRGDCYSLAAIEAMAAGLPVILSHTGGTADIVDEGCTGYLIEVANEGLLAERLEHLLAQPDLRSAMGTAARLAAEQRYDVHANIGKTVQIMRQYLTTAPISS